MPFADTLREVVDNTDGALAGLLMDFEGIAVESYVKDRDSYDIDVVGAEFSVIVKSVRRAINARRRADRTTRVFWVAPAAVRRPGGPGAPAH